jgi:hypothetical protein
MPGRGELVAWSRVLFDQEVLMALNSHGTEGRGAHVTVDAFLHPPASTVAVLYHGVWSDAELHHPPQGQTVRIDLPPGGMAILA